MIKSIEIREGITLEELVNFIILVSLPPKEIWKEGGIKNLLKNKGLVHISIEELDYSPFLKGEGEEVKDIWVYWFKKATEKDNLLEIEEFIKNFEEILNKFKIRDFLENNELRENLFNFFSYLKEKNREKLDYCLKIFLKFILKEKDENSLKLKNLTFLKELEDEKLAEVILEEISTNEDFDVVSFSLSLG
jgi:hypothetical protein